MEQFEAVEIGARIRKARLERGLTQEQLAEMSSFSKRSLQDYETGVTVPYRHLREIGRLLGRAPEWFLHGEQEGAVDAEVLARIEKQLGEVVREQGVSRGILEALARRS